MNSRIRASPRRKVHGPAAADIVHGRCRLRARRALRIPPYLCGSPKFVVVAVNSEPARNPEGHRARRERDGPRKYCLTTCTSASTRSSTASEFGSRYFKDPQYQDVVVWQSTDPAEMLENQFGTGVFQGAATEATNGCGSTVRRSGVRPTLWSACTSTSARATITAATRRQLPASSSPDPLQADVAEASRLRLPGRRVAAAGRLHCDGRIDRAGDLPARPAAILRGR